MPKSRFLIVALTLILAVGMLPMERLPAQQTFERLQYNNPGLVVDLGVGLWAWPLPMDWDGDGDLDLLVSCPDKPYSGTYFFENPSSSENSADSKMPVFKPGVKVGPGMKNLQVSHIAGVPRIVAGPREYVDFLGTQIDTKKTRPVAADVKFYKNKGNRRFDVRSFVDFDDDGLTDVLIGVDDWGFYGWDDGFDQDGRWKRGPLHGLVFVLRNRGTNETPEYEPPIQLVADDQPINVYGNPMPNMADFDGDGDLDLVCGEFLDGFTYFENIGTRSAPKYSARGHLEGSNGPLHMHVQMITPTAIDWDGDGDTDLICGDEDGRVALIENTGLHAGQPQFANPSYFQQEARDVKFGALVTPVSYDWDADGDEDLICGNTSGNIAWIENLGGGEVPRWNAPELLLADGKTIHIQAGPNGSIQGPAEAKWGYTTLSVADWNGDALPDLIVNSIWGKIEWYQNVGSRSAPKLSAKKPVRVDWQDRAPKPAWTWWEPGDKELVTQWRTTPVAHDWNGDGLLDLLVLDQEGYLSWFARQSTDKGLSLLPGKRIFTGGTFDSKQGAKKSDSQLLRLNDGLNGRSGRRKWCLVDWDQDGRLDVLINSKNAHWLRNMGTSNGLTHFADQGPVSEQVLAGHTTSPTIVDWNEDGVPDLLLGAEDGRFYYLKNPLSK